MKIIEIIKDNWKFILSEIYAIGVIIWTLGILSKIIEYQNYRTVQFDFTGEIRFTIFLLLSAMFVLYYFKEDD